MKRFVLLCALLSICFVVGFACAFSRSPALKGFTSIFDGSSLKGWRKLTEYSGDNGLWVVSDGAIVGDQYPEGKTQI